LIPLFKSLKEKEEYSAGIDNLHSRLLPLCFYILYLNIGKRIRSNTLSRFV
jgi:hypothetical protein